MNRKKRKNIMALGVLLSLVVIAAVLVVILVVLVIKKNNLSSDIQESSPTASEYTEATSEVPVEPTEPTKPLSEYAIEYQYCVSSPGADISQINGTGYDILYDYDKDGAEESLKVLFAYDGTTGKVSVIMSNGIENVIADLIELPFTSGSSLDIVGISNNAGSGIGIISRCFNYQTNKYDLQLIVWEYYNDKFTEEWNVVYTGVAAPNCYMQDGYIYGIIRGESVDGNTDSNMNGYILNRSILMSDMKNMGIILPRDTTGACLIEYTRYVTGLVNVVIE